jgi:hypothetical protein
LRENNTQPQIVPTQLIFHSAVSKGESLFDFFNHELVVLESHLYVQEDGDAEQYIDSNVQADANYKANPRALSVESWDDGDPDTVPWTPKQMRRLADIAAWAHLEHDIPLVRAPAWNLPGMGGHTDYKKWSNVSGKTCPGLARRGQVDTIIAMGQAIVDGKLKSLISPLQGDIMLDAATAGQIKKIVQAEIRTVLGNPNDDKDADNTHDSIADIRRDLRAVGKQLDGIVKALAAVTAPPPADSEADSSTPV